MLKTCPICGKEFYSKAGKKVCSPSCRKKDWDKKQLEKAYKEGYDEGYKDAKQDAIWESE